MILGNASGAPGWLAALDINAASLLRGTGFWVIGLLATLQLLIGLLVFRTGWVRRLVIGAGVVLALLFWVFGQSLGKYFTGLATDPNTAPLLILLGLALHGCEQLDFKPLWHKVDHDLGEVLV